MTDKCIKKDNASLPGFSTIDISTGVAYQTSPEGDISQGFYQFHEVREPRPTLQELRKESIDIAFKTLESLAHSKFKGTDVLSKVKRFEETIRHYNDLKTCEDMVKALNEIKEMQDAIKHIAKW